MESFIPIAISIGLLLLCFLAILVVLRGLDKGPSDTDVFPHESSRAPDSTVPQASLPRPTYQRNLHGSAYVVDGDTIVISGVQIRLFGVDAPELDHPYGKKAKWALHALCKGKKVKADLLAQDCHCLLYTSPSPRD